MRSFFVQSHESHPACERLEQADRRQLRSLAPHRFKMDADRIERSSASNQQQ
jgi:hypothetical protein